MSVGTTLRKHRVRSCGQPEQHQRFELLFLPAHLQRPAEVGENHAAEHKADVGSDADPSKWEASRQIGQEQDADNTGNNHADERNGLRHDAIAPTKG